MDQQRQPLWLPFLNAEYAVVDHPLSTLAFTGMKTRTPPNIGKHIQRLISRVSPGQTAVRLPVTPDAGALPAECYANVAARVEAEGGSAVYGWQLWEWPHVLVEAEFHAVWRSPSGEFQDVTPRHDDEAEILFVPDPRRMYRGIPIDNVRMAIRDDLIVHDFILAAKEMTRLRLRSGRDSGDGYISLPANEAEPLMDLLAITERMLSEGLRSSDECVCGSGNKYKRCHGKVLRK